MFNELSKNSDIVQLVLKFITRFVYTSLHLATLIVELAHQLVLPLLHFIFGFIRVLLITTVKWIFSKVIVSYAEFSHEDVSVGDLNRIRGFSAKILLYYDIQRLVTNVRL